MPKEDTADQVINEAKELHSTIDALQQRILFTEARGEIEDVQTTVYGLSQRIQGLRRIGYVFEKNLESQSSSFTTRWDPISRSIQPLINTQSSLLNNEMRMIETQLQQLSGMIGNTAAARSRLLTIQPAMERLESKVTTVENTIRGMYDQFNAQLQSFCRHLDDVEFLFAQLAEATFSLLPSEAGISATKAIWNKFGKEQKGDPEGILFLTDQRILFEQKEEMATKKVLFVTTEKKKVQGLQFEIPVSSVEKVEASKLGFLKNEDHIDIYFIRSSMIPKAHFHIWKDNKTWQALINRARDKEFDYDRIVPVDQSLLDKISAAPTNCPSCGANISTVILRWMDNIKCEYCGAIVRL